MPCYCPPLHELEPDVYPSPEAAKELKIEYGKLYKCHAEKVTQFDMAISAIQALMIQARKVPASDSNKAALELGQVVLNSSRESGVKVNE